MPSQPEPPPAKTESRNRPRDGSSFRKKFSPLPTRSADELDADPNLEAGIKWLVEDLIPLDALTVLYGIGKAGKTTFLTHVAAAVAGGTAFLDRTVVEGPVLWVDLEQQVALALEGLRSAGAIRRKHLVHVYNGVQPELGSITESIIETEAKLVVIDSLSKLLLLRDENDASEVTRAITPLLKVCRDTGAAVVAIHHERKREGLGGRSMRGSSAFLAALDVGISLKVEGGEKDNRRTLEFISRYPSVHGTSMSVRLSDDGYEVLGDRQSFRQEELLKAIGDSAITAEELGVRLGVTRQAVIPSLDKAVRSGTVLKTGSGKRGDPYRFQTVKAASNGDSLSVAELQKAS